MTYKKAQEVLPEHLVEEIQKYLDGDLLYIPKKGRRRGWGSVNGAQRQLQERNEQIRRGYMGGQSVLELSKAFCLSEDSIRKILRRRVMEVPGKNVYK